MRFDVKKSVIWFLENLDRRNQRRRNRIWIGGKELNDILLPAAGVLSRIMKGIAGGLLMNCFWSIQFRNTSKRFVYERMWCEGKSLEKRANRNLLRDGIFEKSRTLGANEIFFASSLIQLQQSLMKIRRREHIPLMWVVFRDQRHDSIIAGFYYSRECSRFKSLRRVSASFYWCGYFITLSSSKAPKWPFYMHDVSPLYYVLFVVSLNNKSLGKSEQIF